MIKSFLTAPKHEKYSIQLLFVVIISLFNNCRSNIDEKPVNNDSILNALNAADTIPSTQQKTIDSVNKVYLDSLKKHMADSSNAEFPASK